MTKEFNESLIKKSSKTKYYTGVSCQIFISTLSTQLIWKEQRTYKKKCKVPQQEG